MPPYQNIRLRKDREDIRRCPTCGFPVRIVRRDTGGVERYEFLVEEALEQALDHQDPTVAALLKRERQGKRTIAMVGMSSASCALAPFDDPDVEIWSLNETHAFPWMLRADRWFQMHPRESFTREVAVRSVHGHYDWLQEKRGIPVYMQFVYEDIPDSVEYPLHAVKERFFKHLYKGDDHIQQLGSTFDFMMALALLEDRFDRYELYGFDMASEGLTAAGFAYQKPGALYWLGVATGMGKEIYTPPGNQLFMAPLYGYQWYPK